MHILYLVLLSLHRVGCIQILYVNTFEYLNIISHIFLMYLKIFYEFKLFLIALNNSPRYERQECSNSEKANLFRGDIDI